MPTANTAGSMAKPACNGETPRTTCNHCADSSSSADIANMKDSAARMPAVNVELRNSRNSSIGLGRRRHLRTNHASAAAPTRKETHDTGSVRPSFAMCLIDQTSATIPPTIAMVPAVSQLGGTAALYSGSRKSPAITAITIRGTLIKNAACQVLYSSSSPPTTGPMAMPTEDTAAQMPSAVALSRGSVKMTRIIDSVVGMIIAPPIPRSERIAMRVPASCANSTSSEARANTANPPRRIRLRPKRSAIALMGTNSPARTRE